MTLHNIHPSGPLETCDLTHGTGLFQLLSQHWHMQIDLARASKASTPILLHYLEYLRICSCSIFALGPSFFHSFM